MMKIILLILSAVPIICFSQTKSQNLPKPHDSLSIKYFKRPDSLKPILIPNKKIPDNIKYSGLVSKSKGNAIPIPNAFKPKDTLLAKKNPRKEELNIKK